MTAIRALIAQGATATHIAEPPISRFLFDHDRGALKVNRKGAPNLLVLKRNIKYIYKADERVESASA